MAPSSKNAAAWSVVSPRETYSGSDCSSSQAASNSVRPTDSDRSPCSWSQKSFSRAEWTNVPFTCAGEDGSGRWAMADNRKARAQSRKLVTFDGESERGNSKDMADRL